MDVCADVFDEADRPVASAAECAVETGTNRAKAVRPATSRDSAMRGSIELGDTDRTMTAASAGRDAAAAAIEEQEASVAAKTPA